MAEPATSRRLAAILAADIAGYSALISTDEEGTVRALKGHQAAVLPMVVQHGGRVIDTAGDGIMAEFGSVLAALKCALAIQATMAERNADVPLDKRLQYRIGINLGDVIFDDARIYGDGINIAARLEGLAEPAGICVSANVHEQTLGKVDCGFDDIGEQALKNIARAVRVYRVRAKVTGTDIKGEILTLPDKPSIAALPFTNMSGDPEQEYFADGITEDIITELSRFSELFVIARNSSFQYKGKSPDVRQAGRELGVRYILEGSIRRASDRVRITGQLVDATTGAHRWADRYDRKLQDIFSVQDEVARTIVSILVAHVNKAEIERTLLKSPTTWQAHDCYMKASSAFASYWTSLNVEDRYQTRRFIEQALSVDPNYARAHALLTFTYTTAWVQPLDASYGDPGTLSRALQSGRKAVQLDPFLPAAHAYLAIVLTFSGQHEASIAEHERAIALNPNFTDWTFGADVLKAGDPARAIELLHKHMRLDPFYVPQALAYLGLAHYMLKQYGKAIPPLRETAARAPNYWRSRAWLTAAYAQSGALDEARVEATELLQLRPEFTASGDLTWYSTIKRREDVDHLVEGFRKAGLPE